MIHLCVVRRNNKLVITSSDTVTFEEKLGPAIQEYQDRIAESYYKDSELLKEFMPSQQEEEVHPALKEHYEKLITRCYDDLLKDCTALQAEHLREIMKRKRI